VGFEPTRISPVDLKSTVMPGYTTRVWVWIFSTIYHLSGSLSTFSRWPPSSATNPHRFIPICETECVAPKPSASPFAARMVIRRLRSNNMVSAQKHQRRNLLRRKSTVFANVSLSLVFLKIVKSVYHRYTLLEKVRIIDTHSWKKCVK